MAKQIVPTNAKYLQTNDNSGTVEASFNVDFQRKRGKVRVSKPIKKIFSENDSAEYTDFAEAASQIVKYGNRYFAMAKKMYRNVTPSDVTSVSGWEEDNTSGVPLNTSGKSLDQDGDYFDGLYLTTENGNQIVSFNGTSYADWWTSTLGQSALSVIGRSLIKTGADGNLYIKDSASKLYKVSTAGTVSKTGQGTLDFSAHDYEFTCMETTSSRLWIGFSSAIYGGGIIEWDMLATSISPNRVHILGAVPRCMPVFNDTPIAIMSDGTIKYFNGNQFTDYPEVRLPKLDEQLNVNFVHPNGWAIIDGLPHVMMAPIVETTGAEADISYVEATSSDIHFPAAIYCLDPKAGLYPRFALSNGDDTDTAQLAVARTGALSAFDSEDSINTKFLCSYEVFTDTDGTTEAILAYHDKNNTKNTSGWLIFDPIQRNAASKNIEMLHRVMESGNSIRAFYQEYEETEQTANVIWTSTNTLNTTDSIDVDDKWLAVVKTGNGAGKLMRVEKQQTSTNVHTITFKDTNSMVTEQDTGTVQFIKYRYMGTADSTTLDYTKLTFPTEARTRKIKLLYELNQASGTTNELDYTIYEQ